MIHFNYLEFKKMMKDKRIFQFFLERIIHHTIDSHDLLLVPTKNIKVAQALLFEENITLIQFIVQEEKIHDQKNKNILESEVCINHRLKQYTIQIDHIIQINFLIIQSEKPEMDVWNFKDDNRNIPSDFYKVIVLNLDKMKHSKFKSRRDVAFCFLLNDLKEAETYVKKEIKIKDVS